MFMKTQHENWKNKKESIHRKKRMKNLKKRKEISRWTDYTMSQLIALSRKRMKK